LISIGLGRGPVVEKDTDRDYFMGAGEAKEYGIIDDVITHRHRPASLSADKKA
jgi:ATP-dependent Clp protease protease subunit